MRDIIAIATVHHLVGIVIDQHVKAASMANHSLPVGVGMIGQVVEDVADFIEFLPHMVHHVDHQSEVRSNQSGAMLLKLMEHCALQSATTERHDVMHLIKRVLDNKIPHSRACIVADERVIKVPTNMLI